ncbi:MAG: pitrilysin family protein [Rhodanobacteraceae bacterium]
MNLSIKPMICAIPLWLLATASAVAAPSASDFPTAPPAPGPAPTIKVPTPVEHTLDNGLRVIVVRRDDLPLVSAKLVILAGSEVDPDRLPAAASLTADMLTHGTETRSATEIANQAAALGGSISADAGWDESDIGITVTTPRLGEALDLVADVAMHPKFAGSELERVRKQAQDGLRLAMKNPGQLAAMVARRAVFGGGMYGHPASGTTASLKAISSADLKALHQRWYRPDNTVLVLAGDIEPEAAFGIADKAFGAWKKPSAALAAPDDASGSSQADALTMIDQAGAGQAGVVAAHLAIPRKSQDYYAGLVTNAVLGGSYSARLNEEIRIKRGLSYGARSSLDAMRDGGWLMASAQTKNPSAVEVVHLLQQQVDSLVSNPPGAEELKARKATMIGSFARSLDTTDGLASQISERAVYGVPLDEINHHIERIEAVDTDKVRAFARKYLGDAGLHIVVVGDGKVFGKAMHKTWPKVRTIKADQLDLSRADLGAGSTAD